MDNTVNKISKSLKVVVISDSHNLHHQMEIPEGDILLHCGDATISSTSLELVDFANWFSNLPHKVKIYGPGKHTILVLVWCTLILARYG